MEDRLSLWESTLGSGVSTSPTKWRQSNMMLLRDSVNLKIKSISRI